MLQFDEPDVPTLCRVCESRLHGACSTLPQHQLAKLARLSRHSSHEPGARLASEATFITSYANVLHGVVKLSKMLEDGRQQVVGLQFPSDLIGRVFGQEHRTSAEAASAVDICRLPKSVVEELINEVPEFKQKVLHQTLRELDEARDWMLTVGRKSAQEKVASLLMLFVRHVGPSEDAMGVEFELPLARRDIADFLGLTVETVSRQLTRLSRDGLIDLENHRQVFVLNLEGLKARCG
jgi:CRP/FNR family transcriptional regulator